MKLRLPKRISLKSLLVLVALFAILIAIAVPWHRSSSQTFLAIRQLRASGHPPPHIYFDQMLDWDPTQELYSIKSGDVFEIPPVGFDATLCQFFEADYVCRPRVILFVDQPPAGSMDLIKKLPSVKQVLFVTSTTSVKKWKPEFPDKMVMSWKEYRALTEGS